MLTTLSIKKKKKKTVITEKTQIKEAFVTWAFDGTQEIYQKDGGSDTHRCRLMGDRAVYSSVPKDNGICSVWSAATSQQNLFIVSVKLPSWMFQHQMLLISKYCFWVCVVIRGKKKKTSRCPHVALKCSSVYLFFLRFEIATLTLNWFVHADILHPFFF